MKHFQIYQIDSDNEKARLAMFMPYNRLKRFRISLSRSMYKKVYDGDVEECESMNKTLEKIFEIFNINRPSDFKGHSLSISDVIEIDGVAYYCDDYGFIKITF